MSEDEGEGGGGDNFVNECAFTKLGGTGVGETSSHCANSRIFHDES